MDKQPYTGTFDRRVIVIGYGSPIRGDDALGPIVAEQLRDHLDDPRIEVLSRHVLTAELAELLQEATLVVFVDVSVDGEIGRVATRTLQPNIQSAGSMAHTLDAPSLLGWVQGLYGKTPDAVLVSTPGESFDYANCRLTPQVEKAAAQVVRRVEAIVQDHLDILAHS